MEATGEQMTLFSQVASRDHANHTAQQVSDLEKKMTATSGRKCLEQFEKLNRSGLWAKTFAGLLIGMEGWYSMRCALTWKLKVTKSSRLYFLLQVSTPRIDAIGYGLLPTPTAVSDAKGGCTRKDAKRQNDTLAHAIHGMVGQTGKTSQLNPLFVAEMMGFPEDWTVLPFLSGETTV